MRASGKTFLASRGGNITMLFAVTFPVLLFAIAMAIDYGRAASARTRLNSAADAAALAALTPAMLESTPAVASAAATNMFNSIANGISVLAPGQTSVTVTITNPGGNTLLRQVAVSYSANVATLFPNILNVNYLSPSGSSTAQASIPPNIDFYLLLDNSPSMALPATQAGINSMLSLTTHQDYDDPNPVFNGCAFACHQASTNNPDTAGNPCADGTAPSVTTTAPYSGGNPPGTIYCNVAKHGAQIDNFQLAKNNGITLRLDELRTGVTDMMTLANNTATSGQWATPPAYRFAAYSMDTLYSIPTTPNKLMALTSSYQSAWTTAAPNFNVMEMFSNNNTCNSSSCTASGGVGDVATNYDNSLSGMLANIPTPGNGTNQPGDKPQAIMFFVTDGVEDEQNVIRLIQPVNGGSSTNYCTQIKAKGIKIAILYTEYLPVPSNPFYVSKVQSFQPNIGSALEACASPGLYVDAAIGASLSEALATLFQASVKSAALIN